MKKNLYLTIAAFSLVLALPHHSAKASVFYWQDPDSGASLTFPDTWKKVNNQNPGDVLTVRAPGSNDFAECRLNAAPEGRFKIYPVGYSRQIQHLNVSAPYWEEFFATYNNPTFAEFRDDAGLGRGFASMTTASYVTAKGAIMAKKAIAFAAYYNNYIYTVECSAEQAAYDKWQPAFLSLVKSVNFKKTTNHDYEGYYRPFLSDPSLKIRGATILDDRYH